LGRLPPVAAALERLFRLPALVWIAMLAEETSATTFMQPAFELARPIALLATEGQTNDYLKQQPSPNSIMQ